jgi:AraC family transcriptional regulator
MITRKLLAPDYLADTPTLRFADHMLLTGTLNKPYSCQQHLPGPGLLTMLEGTGDFRVNGETTALDKTRYLVIGHNSRLSIRIGQPGSTPLLLFFRSSTVDETLEKQKADLCWIERAHPMTVSLRQRLNWLVAQQGNCSSFFALRTDAMILDLLRELIQQALAAQLLAANLKVARTATRVQLFKRLSSARESIHAHYALPLTVTAMAATAQLNSQHFLRMFRDCFGATPHQYLTEVRLDAARQLLTATAEPVSAICRQTGFESCSSFSGLFRTRYGASPTSWRRQLNQPA